AQISRGVGSHGPAGRRARLHHARRPAHDRDRGSWRAARRRSRPAAGLMASTPLGRWAERHALLIDGVVAALLFLYDAMYLTGQYAGFGDLSVPLLVVGLVLSAGMCVLYPFRRRWPFLVPAVVLATAWGYIALGVGLSPAPLVLSGLVLYFLGTRFSWQATFLAALAVAAWVIVAAQPVLERDYLRIGEVGVLVLTGFFVATVGLFAQARRRHVERLGEVNAQLARERDAQAAI